MRPLRAEAATGLSASRFGGDGDAEWMFWSERAALLALYAAKIEALRRSLPRRDIAAGVRAVLNDRRVAMRAMTERRRTARRAKHERRDAERFVEKLLQAKVSPQPEVRPG